VEFRVCSATSLVPLSGTDKSGVLNGSYFQTLSVVLHMFGLLIGPSVRYLGVLRSDWFFFPDAEWSPAYVRPSQWSFYHKLRSAASSLLLLSDSAWSPALVGLLIGHSVSY
jgi:hypothetical protein